MGNTISFNTNRMSRIVIPSGGDTKQKIREQAIAKVKQYLSKATSVNDLAKKKQVLRTILKCYQNAVNNEGQYQYVLGDSSIDIGNRRQIPEFFGITESDLEILCCHQNSFFTDRKLNFFGEACYTNSIQSIIDEINAHSHNSSVDPATRVLDINNTPSAPSFKLEKGINLETMNVRDLLLEYNSSSSSIKGLDPGTDYHQALNAKIQKIEQILLEKNVADFYGSLGEFLTTETLSRMLKQVNQFIAYCSNSTLKSKMLEISKIIYTSLGEVYEKKINDDDFKSFLPAIENYRMAGNTAKVKELELNAIACDKAQRKEVYDNLAKLEEALKKRLVGYISTHNARMRLNHKTYNNTEESILDFYFNRLKIDGEYNIYHESFELGDVDGGCGRLLFATLICGQLKFDGKYDKNNLGFDKLADLLIAEYIELNNGGTTHIGFGQNPTIKSLANSLYKHTYLDFDKSKSRKLICIGDFFFDRLSYSYESSKNYYSLVFKSDGSQNVFIVGNHDIISLSGSAEYAGNSDNTGYLFKPHFLQTIRESTLHVERNRIYTHHGFIVMQDAQSLQTWAEEFVRKNNFSGLMGVINQVLNNPSYNNKSFLITAFGIYVFDKGQKIDLEKFKTWSKNTISPGNSKNHTADSEGYFISLNSMLRFQGLADPTTNLAEFNKQIDNIMSFWTDFRPTSKEIEDALSYFDVTKEGLPVCSSSGHTGNVETTARVNQINARDNGAYSCVINGINQYPTGLDTANQAISNPHVMSYSSASNRHNDVKSDLPKLFTLYLDMLLELPANKQSENHVKELFTQILQKINDLIPTYNYDESSSQWQKIFSNPKYMGLIVSDNEPFAKLMARYLESETEPTMMTQFYSQAKAVKACSAAAETETDPTKKADLQQIVRKNINIAEKSFENALKTISDQAERINAYKEYIGLFETAGFTPLLQNLPTSYASELVLARRFDDLQNYLTENSAKNAELKEKYVSIIGDNANEELYSKIAIGWFFTRGMLDQALQCADFITNNQEKALNKKIIEIYKKIGWTSQPRSGLDSIMDELIDKIEIAIANDGSLKDALEALYSQQDDQITLVGAAMESPLVNLIGAYDIICQEMAPSVI